MKKENILNAIMKLDYKKAILEDAIMEYCNDYAKAFSKYPKGQYVRYENKNYIVSRATYSITNNDIKYTLDKVNKNKEKIRGRIVWDILHIIVMEKKLINDKATIEEVIKGRKLCVEV